MFTKFLSEFHINIFTTLVKKIDFFSAEKTAINGVNWHFSALHQSRMFFHLGLMLSTLKKLALHSVGLKKWQNLV
jgi:hypothetical protein